MGGVIPLSSRMMRLVVTSGGLAILVSIIGGYVFRWTWTGVSNRNLWDWIELLIVPLGLALVAVVFNNWRAAREQEQAAENQREQALRDYLDAMTALMLDHHLSSAKNEVRTVARTRTHALLRRIDSQRKGIVVHFLYESLLLFGDHPIIDLGHADLRGADLQEARLSRIHLAFANLRGATLRGAWLDEAFLNDADLTDADLTGAFLSKASLGDADLTHADLRDADLTAALLGEAKLCGAKLSGVKLSGARLDSARLDGADLSGAILHGADHARLPSGQLVQLPSTVLLGARADRKTMWPEGFDPAAAGVEIVD
jgi:uncharacterized protein YjbI with pentapeptide repeats